MRIDPHTEATRLLAEVDADLRDELARDPATTVEVLFDVTVHLRPPSPPGSGCAVDGSYHPGPPGRIFVANDVTPARQRFTILHEMGHHLIEYDDRLNDLDLDDVARRDEDICNEIAASVLIPSALVSELLPEGTFRAEDVSRLHDQVGASRMACCVAAVRRLRHPGCVILGSDDGTAVFVAHQPATPWRIARDTQQGAGSLLARVGRTPGGHTQGVTQVRFANGNMSGDVFGDAFRADDGWIFQVVVADSHSPWQRSGLNLGLTYTGPEGDDIECAHCGEASAVWGPPCRNCGDRTCPKCDRCSCPVGPPMRACQGYCGLLKPPHQFPRDSEICVDCQ